MSMQLEIERKFVIAMPDTDAIRRLDGYSVSNIEQTYLASAPTVTHRVRSRRYGDIVVYTETKKTRIDKMSALEEEREISEDEYRVLLKSVMPGTVTLTKTRHTFPWQGRTVEIDVYPEWVRSCILEVELDSREAELTLPDFISVIREVTGDKSYSNAAMSREFPKEIV